MVIKEPVSAEGTKVVENKAIFKVVRPTSRSITKRVPISSRVSDLEGKRIGLVWVGFVNGDILIESLTDLLVNRFRDLKFLNLPSGKTESWGSEPTDGTLGELAKENKVDALIVSVGG